MSSDALKLDWCSVEAAKFACTHWHYSKCYPQQKTVRIGVWEHGQFKGVVIFGDGANSNMLKPYGLAVKDGAELVRVALRDHKTTVSRIVSVAIRLLRKQCPGLRLILSYADPSHGHHGGIYQAGGWIYTGKSGSSVEYLAAGRQWHRRAVNAQRASGNDPCKNALTWLRKYRDPKATQIIVPGKHRYLMPLDDEMRARVAPLAKPYPKRAETSSRNGHPVAEGGATPTSALHSERVPSNPADR